MPRVEHHNIRGAAIGEDGDGKQAPLKRQKGLRMRELFIHQMIHGLSCGRRAHEHVLAKLRAPNRAQGELLPPPNP